jgi:hypothetical protein
VPIHVRRDRTRALRDLAARKNLEFRRSMLGKTISVVTLDGATDSGSPGSCRALSDNYLKITLAKAREANRIEEIRIGGLTPDGLSEAGSLTILN